MLYLKSLTMHRFKSFRHAELLFSKGFTCVVGPNGSGKSNICDALLFGLGEGSLRRLRARTLDSLITFPASKSSGLRKAYVSMDFGGDEAITVTRAVRSDGKSLYRVNGKRMTRSEVVDLVNRHGIRADETNTITQGEINKFNDLNPKERRELIDIASGIEEFERKKEEALKELEKVSQKVSEGQIMLNERLNFLKDLEAEKASAERYIEMSSRLKLLNYSIVMSKKQDAEAMLSEYTKAMAITDARKNELGTTLDGIAKKIAQFNAERQQLTKELGESAKTMGEINAKLEAIKMEIAKLDISSSNHTASISEGENAVKGLESDDAATKETMTKNIAAIESLSKEIKDAENKLAKSNIKTESTAADFGNVAELNTMVKGAEASLEEVNNKILGIKAEISNLSSSRESLGKGAKNMEETISELRAKKAEIAKRQKEVNSRFSSLNAATKALDSEIDLLNKKTGSAEQDIIEAKSQRAVAQSRGGAVYERIKEKFGKEKGFYGRVSELCTYDPRDSAALEAAAGARLDYIIVDSIGTADTIIKHLRENNLGRATFIPMKELLPSPEGIKEKEARQALETVQFDPKFKTAFAFVFNNTYLVEDSEKAKKIGVGKHRYVTVSGDVIEQSGVISGGAAQRRISTANLDKQIKELTDNSIQMKKTLGEKVEELNRQRKEAAYAEMELKTGEQELASTESELKRREEEKSGISRETKRIEEREARAAKELSEREREHQKAQQNLEEARERLSKAYSNTVEISKHLAKYGLKKEDLERLEAMRKESEALKIRKAEMQKENQMLEEKINGIRKQASERRKAIEEARKLVKESQKKERELETAKKETESRITSDNETSKKIYGKISGLDSEIARMTVENNRIAGEHSNLDRQLSELKMKRSQAETRIGDFTAELAVYKEAMEAVKGNIAEMEKEAIVLNAKISELGNVNLKAPEMFDEKKRNVDEAVERVNTLENERQAVLRMIEEIDSKKLQTFMSTLNEIAKNFSKLYNYIFPGSASIRLENPKDPFNSGLEILVTNDKSTKILSSMSGGEKSLLSLILIFSIHMCKPSSLYIFDEVDAALDKENSKKLSHLIKEMSKGAQFVVVSHNDSLIVNADTAVGVAKSNEESRAVGIEISSILNRKQ